MSYEKDQSRARLALAQKAALKLANLISYKHVEEPSMMRPRLRNGLHVPTRRLTILPSDGKISKGIMAAAAETGTDLLIIRVGSFGRSGAGFYFTLFRSLNDTVQSHGPLCLWASEEHELFLIPDPLGDDRQGQCFTLKKGVQPAELPWNTLLEAGVGIGHADVLLRATGPLRSTDQGRC